MVTSYTRQTFRTFRFHISGQREKARSGPVECCLQCLIVTDCIYSIRNKCASAAPCHAPHPHQSSSKPSLWAVFLGNFKASLPQMEPRKRPATSRHDRGFARLTPSLSLCHAHTCTWGEHNFDITACKKVIFILWQTLPVWSYFRWMLSSVVIYNISSFIQE